MAAGSSGASVDSMLADAIAKMDAMNKRMDALETGTGSKSPIKGDDDDDKKDDGISKVKTKICADDDDDDDKKDDAFPPKKKDDSKKADAKKADDDDDDKKDDAATVKFGDDGELEIKHEPGGEKKPDRRKDSAKKADTKKADTKKADAKKADDDDDKKDDDDDDKKDDAFPPKKAKDDDDDDDKKDDAAKADSIALRRQIEEQATTLRRLEALLKPKSDDEHAAFADAQARADAVFNGFGQRAPRPLEGEALVDYRKRLATKLKSYSPAWKSVKFSQLPEQAFEIAETQVYADAVAAASNPVDLNPGELREVTKIDPQTGVRTIVFYGKESFVKQMGRPGRRVAAFRTLASQ